VKGISEEDFYDIGAATISITPEASVALYSLDGYQRTSNSVHSELMANAITIKYDDMMLAIVSLDLIWVDRILTEKIRKWADREFKEYKVEPILVATHSHSTPQISETISNSARPDSVYIDFLYNQLCKAIKCASTKSENCYAKLHISQPNLTVNRRKKILSIELLKRGIFKKVIANRPNKDGDRDDAVYSVWFYNHKDREKAVILNYACHPTLFRDNAVSADFPGLVSNHLKRHKTEDLVVCFLQGFAGNIKANLTQSSCSNYKKLLPYIYSCLFDRVQFNKNISQAELESFSLKIAHSALQNKGAKNVKPALYFLHRRVPLPMRDKKFNQYANLEIFYLSIGKNLKIIGVGGEIFSEYSTWIRELMRHDEIDLLTVGYCNDMIGYIPTYQAMQEGGYEVERTFAEFSHPSPFSDKVESIVRKNISDLISINSREL